MSLGAGCDHMVDEYSWPLGILMAPRFSLTTNFFHGLLFIKLGSCYCTSIKLLLDDETLFQNRR